MAKIVIENLYGKILLVQDPEKSLLEHFHHEGLDWMHACGGKGRCTTCKVIVQSGSDYLTPLTPSEGRYRSMSALKMNERLSCQVKVRGDIVLVVPDECKLSHITYSP